MSEAIAPRPAATVIVLRQAVAGVEILMVKRTAGASFMANAYVFPGGKVETEDGTLRDDASDWATFARAASRELSEEAGIIISPEHLVPLAHWITPSAEPKRFDARFFVTSLADNQIARHDNQETVAVCWQTPGYFIAEHEEGRLKLPPPTLCNLEDLSGFARVDEVLAWARSLAIMPILPKLITADNDTNLVQKEVLIVLPWDADYSRYPGEGRPIDSMHQLAARRSRLLFKDGRWWMQRKVT